VQLSLNFFWCLGSLSNSLCQWLSLSSYFCWSLHSLFMAISLKTKNRSCHNLFSIPKNYWKLFFL